MLNNDPNLENKDARAVQEQEQGSERREPPAPLGKSQKIAVVVLAFFAILVIGFWFRQFKQSISQPFAYETATPDNITLEQQDSEAVLRTKDTDGDSISDWDELYFYNTSPYLEDSDSDGMSDKDEIAADKDPNCPAGRDCYATTPLETEQVEVDSTQDDTTLNILNQLNIEPETETPVNTSEPTSQDLAQLEALMSGEIDAVALRQILLDYGMQKEHLDQMSDEELLQSFKETLAEEQTSP